MTRRRRVAAVITALLASAASFLTTAHAALAMRVGPQDGVGSVPSTALARNSGASTGELALISIGTALLVAVVTALVVRARYRSRLRPALG